MEKEVVEKRNEYSESIQNIKTEFLTKRANYAKESDEKIKRLAKEANKVSFLLFKYICIDACNKVTTIIKS